MDNYQVFKVTTIAAAMTILVSACGGGGGSTTPPGGNTVAISGSVTAPGGAIAFRTPSVMDRMMAGIFGKNAYAAISGVSSVGGGVTVNLIEVDAAGTQVDNIIATTTTASDGSYSLDAPEGFTPGPQFIVRIVGITESMDTRVTSLVNDVDPQTDASSDLVTTSTSDLTTLTVSEIDEINAAVGDVTQDIDTTGLTADQLSTALSDEAINNEETNNIINSSSATGQVCGNVTDSNGTALNNIRIVVRDFGNWVTRNKTKTDSIGNYCVNVPDGNYIVGALNFTNTSFAASEWWSTSGTSYIQHEAEQLTVAANTIMANFQLEPGARLQGSVTAAAGGAFVEGTALENVRVLVRNYETMTPLASARVKDTGLYRVNVFPGSYMLSARNKTLQWSYASEVYDGANGGSHRNIASLVNLVAGTTTNVDFALEPGLQLTGEILDNVAGNPVTGVRVRINIQPQGAAFRLRTNKEGKYRIWLRPAIYNVGSYGTFNSNVDMTTTSQVQNFTGPVTTVSGVLKDSGNIPVSQAKIFLRTFSGGFINQELSNSDGTFTLYSQVSAGDNKIAVRIDDERSYGSTIYLGQNELLLGTDVSTITNTAIGDIILPDAGTLKGTVYLNDGITPANNIRVQVRSSDINSSERFVDVYTRGDGTYTVSLPAGSYRSVRAGQTSGTNANNVNIIAGQVNVTNFTLP